MIATDHAPHTPEEKQEDIIWQADCGFPGVETQMPLMLSEVAAGRMTLEHYVRISSANPARAFGLYPMKGRLAVGAHADIAVIDMAREEIVQAARLHSRGKITPFEGRKTVGAPVHTLVRGRFVQRDRTLVPDMAGHGRQVTGIQSMPKAKPRNTEMSLAHLLGAGAMT
jgi:dihydroorotase